MSITQQYRGKIIAVLNAEGQVGKVLLKKLLQQMGQKLQKIIIVDSRSSPKHHSNSHPQKPLSTTLLSDNFFKSTLSPSVQQKIETLCLFPLSSSSSCPCPQIDILFNCHIPLDLTRNPLQSCLSSHITKTQNICTQLQKLAKINKIITISSIYGQNHGIVSQGQGEGLAIGNSISSEKIQKLFKNQGKWKEQLSDIFANDYQIWQWSVVYREALWARLSGAKENEIVRLPIVGPTLEGFEGYVHGFNSLISLVYDVGKKNINALQGNTQNIIDMIPADFVANYLLVIGILSFNESQKNQIQPIKQKNSFNQSQIQQEKQAVDSKGNKIIKIIVHNLSTSSRNPVYLSRFAGYISDAWVEYSPDDYKPNNVKIHQKKWQRKAYSIQSKLPNNAKARLAHLFDIKSWKIQVQQEAITNNKKFETIKKYRYFLQHEWICESNKSIDYFAILSHQDQIRFNFNVNSINWRTYAKLCVYSINKHLLGIHVQKFNPTSMDLLTLKKSTYFSDILWALTQGKSIPSHSSLQLKKYILSSKSVKQAISHLVQLQSSKLEQSPTSYQKLQQEFYKIADDFCTQMFSQYSMPSIRAFAWFLHKVFRTIYEKVVVDKNAIMKLRNHDQKTNGPIVIIPTHRSYIDFLIMSYVFFGYGIKVPHIAAAEDFLNMAVVHILLRKSGAFFIKRDQKKYRGLYKAIMSQYITKLLTENHYLEFFIQGTRSRVGKMLQPKFGILSIVCRNVLDGKIPDAQILPVTINYQKILEGTSFTYQLMGQTKVKQSLSRLIKAVDVLKQNYGRIYIQLCEPISIKSYFSKPPSPSPSSSSSSSATITTPQSFQSTLSNLGYQIVYNLTSNLVITPPAILASILLMDRIGISDDRLAEKVQWLSRQIASRGIRVARTQSDSSISISNTLNLMGDVVNKSKKDMFEVQVSFDQDSFVQLFTLTYYRNTLTHIFFEEAIIAVALASFGYEDMTNCRVLVDNLRVSVDFLAGLLKREYVLQQYIAGNPKRFQQLIHDMSSRGTVQLKTQKSQSQKQKSFIGIKNPDSNIFLFYCSLIWPIVQSYWICILYFFKLIKDNLAIEPPKLQSEIQWFGQSLFTERMILHLEAISMDTIKNSLGTYKAMKIIGQGSKASKEEENGERTKELQGKNQDEVIRNGMRVLVKEGELKNLERRVENYLKSKYANSFKGTLGKGSVHLDFPFLSKL